MISRLRRTNTTLLLIQLLMILVLVDLLKNRGLRVIPWKTAAFLVRLRNLHRCYVVRVLGASLNDHIVISLDLLNIFLILH